MYKFTGGLLIFFSGLGLGWFMHNHWGNEPMQTAQPVMFTPLRTVNPESPASALSPTLPIQVDSLASLLGRNAFEAVLARYETLQLQASETVVADARAEILAYARLLIADRHFSLAKQLLEKFLVAAFRDVEARSLLAAALHGQGDFRAAIDHLYVARGYAFRPAMLKEITGHIRAIVAERSQSLRNDNDHHALLAMYQQLTQLEPDHAAYFMGLAATQLAMDDKEAARRSLLLVSHDPDVGAQAQAMLSELRIALNEVQDTQPPVSVTEVVGIPLERSGNHFIVEAKPSQRQRIRLLIDTGASLTIFIPEVLEQQGIRYKATGRSGVFNTANGPVQAPIYIFDALSVGDWQVNQLEVGILDLGSGSGIDGLLGMNFLSHFQFFIDQNEAQLRLSVN
ncbi:retropepsin-like aspartic protease [Sulfuriflexus mobilis]|uniref:retropepsin-like aspartic protease n=1 Tax=Sulfuriflexus mobilis TaxID=1811807 RepID=UPI000F81F4F6|nr:retropepsin-like aspartic protease [Sulfuriflexus mobilis]